MAECPSCGADVAPEASDCPECGVRLSEPTASFEPLRGDEDTATIVGAVVEGPVLIVRKGPQPGERFFIDRPRLTIGRDPKSDVFLNDMTVSRTHAIVECAVSTITVRDGGSLNRTYVNGAIVDEAVLRDGDVVQIGTFQMVFVSGSDSGRLLMTRDYLTIGEVVQRLQGAYPDLSISKVRFLEEEGLVAPERTAGGYRKFSQADVARVEMILRLQKEHFLPLAVIREKLADFDRGRIPVELQRGPVGMTEPLPLAAEDEGPLALDEAQSALGIPGSFIRELSEFGLVQIGRLEGADVIERPDVQVVHAAWDLRKFGVEPRHLRMYENFSDREAALFSQILMPAFRHRTPESKQKLAETLSELSTLTDELKSRLLRRALAKAFEDLS